MSPKHTAATLIHRNGAAPPSPSHDAGRTRAGSESRRGDAALESPRRSGATFPTTTPAPTDPAPNPKSKIENRKPAALPPLSPEDRDKLSLLFRTNADAVSFIQLREEDPLDLLAWLEQPHIQPWRAAIAAAHKSHQDAATQASLARALRDITRILDLEADSTLRIRAVSAIIRLANAIHRASRASSSADSSPLKGASDGRQGPRGSASAPLVRLSKNPQRPGGVRESSDNRSASLTQRTDELLAAREQMAHPTREAARELSNSPSPATGTSPLTHQE